MNIIVPGVFQLLLLHVVSSTDPTTESSFRKLSDKPCLNKTECSANADCQDGLCICSQGYFFNEDNNCERRRNLGETCKLSEQCNDQVTYLNTSYSSLMTCIDDTCTCDPTQAHVTKDGDGESICAKLAGVSCTPWDFHTCTPGSDCHHTLGVCHCDSMLYFETPEGTCEERRKWEQPCNKSNQCNWLRDGLICSEESDTCQCDVNRVVNPETRRCHLKLFSHCSPFDTVDEDGRVCGPNAKCDRRLRKCICRDYSKPAKELKDHCYIKEGGSCYGDLTAPITSKTCLPGLLCRNRTCTCPYKEFQEYNETLEKCQSHVSGPCNESEDCEDPHAECIKDSPQSALQCSCKTGYKGVGKQCQVAFGEKCGQREDSTECDTLVPLECSSRGICECPDDLHVYNRLQQVCEKLVGAKCYVRQENIKTGNCMEGATCKMMRGFDTMAGVCHCEPDKVMQDDRTCV